MLTTMPRMPSRLMGRRRLRLRRWRLIIPLLRLLWRVLELMRVMVRVVVGLHVMRMVRMMQLSW